jgi:formylglycine-generating enzyme required for sulfatase activity
LGDPRFRKDAWYLPREPQLGFVHVPAGPVTVGSDMARDDWARDDEQPLFDVDAPEFYIARYPVTVAQFRAYLEDAGLEPRDADSLKGAPNQPVVWVYWEEAMNYARWLTEQLRDWQETPETVQRLLLEEGWEVCLPSEVQWERAARGRDGRLYPWGDTFETDRANTRETGLGRPSAVGAFPRGASPFGALDMSGNVWEWTSSEYRPYAERWQQAVSAWSDAQEHPVLRGGSFHNDSHAARCATRLGLDRHSRDLSLGFRVALAPGSGGPLVDEDGF